MKNIKLIYTDFYDDSNWFCVTTDVPILEDGWDTGCSFFYEVSMKQNGVRITKFYKSYDSIEKLSSVDFVGGLNDVMEWFKVNEFLLVDVD